MPSGNWRNLAFLLIRFLSSVVVTYLLVAPTEIHRGDSSSSNLKFVFHGGHHFCLRPEARAINVSKWQIIEALNLPRRSSVNLNDRVTKFGECRAKVKKAKKDVSLCNCDPPLRFTMFYRLQLIYSTVSLLAVSFVVVFNYPWEFHRKYAPILISDSTACCVYIIVAVYNFPSLRDQSQFYDYFGSDPLQWTIALCISLTILVASLLFMSYVMFEFVHRKNKSKKLQRRKVVKNVKKVNVTKKQLEEKKKQEKREFPKPDIEMAVEDFMIGRQLVKRVPQSHQKWRKTWP